MRKPAIPLPPSDLSAESKHRWREIHQGWLLDASARVLLTTALRADDRASQARGLVAKDGMVIKVGKSTRAHPALKVLQDAETTKLRAWRALGLDVAQPGPMGRPPGRGPA
jgi:phage terminase small subunit